MALPLTIQFIVGHVGHVDHVDHVERTADTGALVHDLPSAIEQTLVAGGFTGSLGASALNTILHRISVLSKAHQMGDATNPARDPAVRELLRRVRRAYAARGAVTSRKTALTKDPLTAMLATCTDGLIGVRDRALILFVWASGGRRRSEASAAVIENLQKVDDQTYLYRLAHSKTDQLGTDHTVNADKPVADDAAAALSAWLAALGVTSGAIFRRIRGTKAAEPLSGQAVGLIVKRRAALAGLAGDFGAHSLRSGFVTEAGRQNVPLGETMALTGHRSVQTVMRYFQAGAVSETRAAQLLRDESPDATSVAR